MGVFQSNVFQNNVFQGPHAGGATATAAVALYGHWRGPARGGKKRKPLLGRTRLLSELDPPLFTPEEILNAPPANDLDDPTVAKIEAAALEAFADIMDKAARRDLQRKHYNELMARERELIDDDETFMIL